MKPRAPLPRSHLSARGPWLVTSAPGNPIIRLDVGSLDRLVVVNSTLRFGVDDTTVEMSIADGPRASRALAMQLAPYLRRKPIVDPEVYKDARRRLERLRSGARPRPIVQVGARSLRVDRDFVIIGKRAFRRREVAAYAMAGANLPLPRNAVIQAAMATLVEPAGRRTPREAREVLSKRIARYEARVRQRRRRDR